MLLAVRGSDGEFLKLCRSHIINVRRLHLSCTRLLTCSHSQKLPRGCFDRLARAYTDISMVRFSLLNMGSV